MAFVWTLFVPHLSLLGAQGRLSVLIVAFPEHFDIQKGKQEVTKVVSVLKKVEKLLSVSIHLKEPVKSEFVLYGFTKTRLNKSRILNIL